jgi:arylsulfatase A-like enzyme
LRDAYESAISYLDDRLGRLFDELDRQGVTRDTVIIVTSDHGEQFGEHNLVEHVNSLYLSLLHVPLLIVDPETMPAGTRTRAWVSLRDLPATILDLAGLTDPVGFPGESLRRVVRDRESPGDVLLAEVQRATNAYPDWYPARRGAMKSVLFDGWQYIRNYGDGGEELYDLRADPSGLRDLAPTLAGRLDEYRGLLARVLGQAP